MSCPHSSPALSPVLLAGPTGVGKSALAIAVAQELGGEILSVDSMQVYRGLDIGTAKPSAADRALIPHHLIDILDLPQRFDAAQFCSLARRTTQEIQRRGNRPVLCGGTGLYFQAFLTGVGQGPPSDPALRAELENQPLPQLLEELKTRDPPLFEKIDQQNRRRVVRALEVIRLTGQPFSALRSSWDSPVPLLILSRPAGILRQRIEARVDSMFSAGLVDETRRLLDRGLERSPTARQALGYRQAIEHLRQERSLSETIALVKIRTWQFARRQLTWFKKRPGGRWIHLEQDEDANLERLLEAIKAEG